jgi:uncharacterized protein YbjQ (UPF0145 family)
MSSAPGPPPPPPRPVTRTPSGYTVAELAALTPEEFETRSLHAVQAGQLPLRAQQRLADLRDHGAWTSDLSVSEFDVLGSVGFSPVGQVMGTSVYQIGYSGTWWCGGGGQFQQGGGQWGVGSGWQGTQSRYVNGPSAATPTPLIKALYDVRRRALNRMTAEAVALGGDGVVGVELTMRPFPGAQHALEFAVIGTAVRAAGEVRPSTPFLSDLSGQDFVKLIQSGWVPVGIAMGVDVTVRHDDWNTRSQARSWSNTEIGGYTQLVQETRDGCRSALETDVKRLHGEGVVVRDMTLRIHEQECTTSEGARDHIAEATILGTAIARFSRTKEHTGPRTLPILRVGRRTTEGMA